MIIKSTKGKFTLFTKLSIAFFSILCTYFCGSLMLAYNLNQLGKRKQAWFMFIGSVILYAILLSIIKGFHAGSLIELIVPNIILGFLIAYPVWDYLLPVVDEFKPKSILVPLILTIIIWGSLIIGNLLFVKK